MIYAMIIAAGMGFFSTMFGAFLGARMARRLADNEKTFLQRQIDLQRKLIDADQETINTHQETIAILRRRLDES